MNIYQDSIIIAFKTTNKGMFEIALACKGCRRYDVAVLVPFRSGVLPAWAHVEKRLGLFFCKETPKGA